jgi:hypothetical protein
MTRAAAVGRHFLVWLSRVSLWIVVGVLIIAVFELAYFGGGNTALFGCSPKIDTLFYFACNGETSNVILMFVFNLPVLFVYAVGSTVLGFPPPRPAFALLFYVLDAIFVLAVLRLFYLLNAAARRLVRWQAAAEFPES